MTTDNTVAEIEAAFGIEFDRHLCVEFSDSGPPSSATSPFF
jgi:hypothetical protein